MKQKALTRACSSHEIDDEHMKTLVLEAAKEIAERGTSPNGIEVKVLGLKNFSDRFDPLTAAVTHWLLAWSLR